METIKQRNELAPMTDQQADDLIAEAQRLLKNITPGPWAWEWIAEKSNEWAVGQAWDAKGRPLEGQLPADEELTDTLIERRLVGMNESGHANAADAEFIAAAPRLVAALVERVSRQPQEILSRETVDEPPEDLRAAGEAMAWADYDEMLGCIAMILSAHRLNGETHAHMLRWKIRQLAASVSHQQEAPKECVRVASGEQGVPCIDKGPQFIRCDACERFEGQQEPPAIAALGPDVTGQTEALIRECDVGGQVAASLAEAIAAEGRQQEPEHGIRAHVEGCSRALSVPVDLCECGGRWFKPDPPSLTRGQQGQDDKSMKS